MLLQRSPPGSATPGPSARMRFHEAEETPAFAAAVASPPFCAMQLPAQINTTQNILASISHSPVTGIPYRITPRALSSRAQQGTLVFAGSSTTAAPENIKGAARGPRLLFFEFSIL